MTPELYVLRHGETVWNAQHRMQGRLNSALTPKGVTQAQRQGRVLATRDLTGFDLRCSPSGRAFQTAAIVLGDIAGEITTDPDLREIDVGEWSGKLRVEMVALVDDPRDTPDGPLGIYEHAPGGEGFGGLRARCERVLARLSGPSVLVTHGMTSRMLRAVVLGVATDDLMDLPGGQGVVFHLKGGVQKMLS